MENRTLVEEENGGGCRKNIHFHTLVSRTADHTHSTSERGRWARLPSSWSIAWLGRSGWRDWNGSERDEPPADLTRPEPNEMYRLSRRMIRDYLRQKEKRCRAQGVGV